MLLRGNPLQFVLNGAHLRELVSDLPGVQSISMAADGEGDPPQDQEQDRSSLIAHFQVCFCSHEFIEIILL